MTDLSTDMSTDMSADFFDLPTKSGKSGCSRCTSYTLINVIAAFAHFFNFLVTIIIGDERIYPVYETFADWHAVPDAVTDACPINCPAGAYSFNGNNNTVIVNPLAKKSTYSLSLLWLIATFHLLSFVFQFGVSLRCSGYDYNDKIQRGINPARFVEYSVSATLMLVCIALVSGITEQYALLAIVTLTFTTMILGMIAELLFDDIHLPAYVAPPRFVSGDKVKDKVNAKPAGDGGSNRTVQTMRTIGWTAHFLGWVTMLAAYGGIILRNFYFSVSASVNKPPDWVQYAILSVFGLYNVFGVVQFIQLWHKMPLTVFCCVPSINIKPKHDPAFNKWIENIYVINSLVSKTLLGYLIIVNLVIDDARSPCI